MTKAELLAALEARPDVSRVLAEVLQDQDTVKINAGVNPYLVPFMYSQDSVSTGENVLMYVYDEGTAQEKAEFDKRSFARIFGDKVYTGSLADVKARAVEIIGSADESQAQAALDVMADETTTSTKDDNWETELGVISRLGMSEGVTILETMKGAGQQTFGTDVIKRFIESQRGVNLADAQTIAFVQGLADASAITQAQADALLETNTETVDRWPNLQLWQIVEALRS